jgi:hypothetical protein
VTWSAVEWSGLSRVLEQIGRVPDPSLSCFLPDLDLFCLSPDLREPGLLPDMSGATTCPDLKLSILLPDLTMATVSSLSCLVTMYRLLSSFSFPCVLPPPGDIAMLAVVLVLDSSCWWECRGEREVQTRSHEMVMASSLTILRKTILGCETGRSVWRNVERVWVDTSLVVVTASVMGMSESVTLGGMFGGSGAGDLVGQPHGAVGW